MVLHVYYIALFAKSPKNSLVDGFTQADCRIRNIELTFRRREKRGTRTECPSKQLREFVLLFS